MNILGERQLNTLMLTIIPHETGERMIMYLCLVEKVIEWSLKEEDIGRGKARLVSWSNT
jgi:hypothetical protein